MQAPPSPTATPPPSSRVDKGKGKEKASSSEAHPNDAATTSGTNKSQVLSTQTTYPPAPVNVKSPPFSVLVTLYEKLANEKKPEKRRKALAGWFSVCYCFLRFVACYLDFMC